MVNNDIVAIAAMALIIFLMVRGIRRRFPIFDCVLLGLALGTALIVIISVEFLRARQGVGYMTFYYWEVLNPEKMYAGLLVVMGLGVLLTYALQWLQRKVMPWQRD